jgi:hypothetical protein
MIERMLAFCRLVGRRRHVVRESDPSCFDFSLSLVTETVTKTSSEEVPISAAMPPMTVSHADKRPMNSTL